MSLRSAAQAARSGRIALLISRIGWVVVFASFFEKEGFCKKGGCDARVDTSAPIRMRCFSENGNNALRKVIMSIEHRS